jgi:hypothetical protein
VLLLAGALFSFDVHTQPNPRNLQKESVIWDQLRVAGPELVEIFKQGTERMDAGDYAGAVSFYQKVVNGAPMFDPALRRLGICLSASGDSPENLTSLAQFLAFPGRDKSAPLHRATSEGDTHPCPADRFRLVREVRGETWASDTTMVWDLFENRDALTKEMSDLIDQSVYRSVVPDAAVPKFKEVDL